MTLLKFRTPNLNVPASRPLHMRPFFSDFFESFLTNDLGEKSLTESEWMPGANISENEKSFSLDLAVPGMKKEDVKISLNENVLEVSGERKEEKNVAESGYTRKEFSYGKFTRSFTLPEHADGEKISAQLEHGILKLNIPKKDTTVKNTGKEIKIS